MTLPHRAKARLEAVRTLLTNINQNILPGIGFELWDKSTVPAVVTADMPVLVIADEGVLAALIRRPSMHTMLNLWVTQRIDLRNGSLFDLVAHPANGRPKELIKRLRGPNEEIPRYFQIVLKVEFKQGIPVQSSYVFHHVLGPGNGQAAAK